MRPTCAYAARRRSGRNDSTSLVCVACLSHARSSVNKRSGGSALRPDHTCFPPRSTPSTGASSRHGLAVVIRVTVDCASGFASGAKGASVWRAHW